MVLVFSFGRTEGAEIDFEGQFEPELAGARLALPATHSTRGFWWGDAFLGCHVPLSLQLTEHLKLRTRLDFSAGYLDRHDDDAATFGVGPVFVLERQGWPLSLEAGSGTTFITRHDFNTIHLGTGYQFTTHIGLNWRFSEHFRLTYRFEHTSNAGFAKPNPGINFHALALSYLF